MNWTITYYSESVQNEILAMPAGFLARFIKYADRMELYGPDLGMPHTRSMGEGLFELRLKPAEGIARIFYCTMIGKRIVMLHHLLRKQKKYRRKNLP